MLAAALLESSCRSFVLSTYIYLFYAIFFLEKENKRKYPKKPLTFENDFNRALQNINKFKINCVCVCKKELYDFKLFVHIRIHTYDVMLFN